MMARKPTYAQLEQQIRVLQRNIESVLEDHLTAERLAGETRSDDADLTTSIENERLIREKDRKFDHQAKELKNINITLDVLMGKHDRQIKVIKDMVYRNFNKLILPDLYELKNKLKRESNRKMIDLIIDNFERLLAPETDRLTSERYKLTKTELKVATMIRNGMPSRQIGEHLNISGDTVAFHRKNLRRKLGISRSGKELSQFLQNNI
jgi:DNA-binding CsgD family transcriptional regulator